MEASGQPGGKGRHGEDMEWRAAGRGVVGPVTEVVEKELICGVMPGQPYSTAPEQDRLQLMVYLQRRDATLDENALDVRAWRQTQAAPERSDHDRLETRPETQGGRVPDGKTVRDLGPDRAHDQRADHGQRRTGGCDP